MQSTKAGEINAAVVMYGGRATAGKKPRKDPIKVKVISLPRGVIRLEDHETGKLVDHTRTGSPVFWEPVPANVPADEEPETGLLPFTVDVAGSGRHEGERGYTYVVLAPSAEIAQRVVIKWHSDEYDDTDVIHERTVQGVPVTGESGDVWNDMRDDDEMKALIEAAKESDQAQPVEKPRYDLDTWQAAFEAAQLQGFCPIDSREQTAAEHSELAAFLAEQYDHDKIERDDYILQAAIDAAGKQFSTWSAAQFLEVVDSYIDSHLYAPVIGGQSAYIQIHDPNMDMTYRFHRVRP